MTAVERSVRVMIRGRVQGVGYRAWCARTAAALGLSGWVRNRHSGDVEAVFSGPTEIVEDMLRRAAEGPRFAYVLKVDIIAEEEPLSGAFDVTDTL